MFTRTIKLATFPAGASSIFGKKFLSMNPFGRCQKRSTIIGPHACCNKGSILEETPGSEEIGLNSFARRAGLIGYIIMFLLGFIAEGFSCIHQVKHWFQVSS